MARTVAQVLPATSSAVDILFVIDDSRSMADEQAQLGIWSNKLFEVLAVSGELPDLHIAVTSSSVAMTIAGNPMCTHGTGGSYHVGQAVLSGPRFIRDIAGASGRDRNYTGTLTDTFAKMAKVGDSGCGFEQPFKAARMALSPPTSKEFLRPDALLLVVFVTDEDDCSARDSTLFSEEYGDACSPLGTLTGYRCFEHGVRCYDGKGSREFGDRRDCRPDDSSPYMESVTGFATFLKHVKPNPAQVVVAGIYGKPNRITAIRDEKYTFETPRLADVCGIWGREGVGATPAVRMNGFLAEFGGRASQSSICEQELSWAMREAGLVTRGAATRSHCLRGELVDTDAAAAGIQPACRVDARSADGTVREVPFTIDVDDACETETQLAFRVFDAASNETLTVACDVATTAL